MSTHDIAQPLVAALCEEKRDQLGTDQEALMGNQEREQADEEGNREILLSVDGREQECECRDDERDPQEDDAGDPSDGMDSIQEQLEQPVRIHPSLPLGDVGEDVMARNGLRRPDVLTGLEVPAEVEALDLEEAESDHDQEERGDRQISEASFHLRTGESSTPQSHRSGKTDAVLLVPARSVWSGLPPPH